MNDVDKTTNHVTTLKITNENFQKLSMPEIAPVLKKGGWEYNQSEHPTGSTQHLFKRKWTLCFSKEVLPSLKKNESRLYSLAKASWVIEDQARQKIALANVLGIVGNSAEQKYINRTAERLVQKGKAKNLKEALEMIS